MIVLAHPCQAPRPSFATGEGWYEQMIESPQYTLEWVHQVPDFWALSEEQLAKSCLHIAQGRIRGSRPLLRSEALRLFLLWQESLQAPCRTRDQSEQRVNVLAALRKRTIQILVRISATQPEPGSSESTPAFNSP